MKKTIQKQKGKEKPKWKKSFPLMILILFLIGFFVLVSVYQGCGQGEKSGEVVVEPPPIEPLPIEPRRRGRYPFQLKAKGVQTYYGHDIELQLTIGSKEKFDKDTSTAHLKADLILTSNVNSNYCQFSRGTYVFEGEINIQIYKYDDTDEIDEIHIEAFELTLRQYQLRARAPLILISLEKDEPFSSEGFDYILNSTVEIGSEHQERGCSFNFFKGL